MLRQKTAGVSVSLTSGGGGGGVGEVSSTQTEDCRYAQSH